MSRRKLRRLYYLQRVLLAGTDCHEPWTTSHAWARCHNDRWRKSWSVQHFFQQFRWQNIWIAGCNPDIISMKFRKRRSYIGTSALQSITRTIYLEQSAAICRTLFGIDCARYRWLSRRCSAITPPSLEGTLPAKSRPGRMFFTVKSSPGTAVFPQ